MLMLTHTRPHSENESFNTVTEKCGVISIQNASMTEGKRQTQNHFFGPAGGHIPSVTPLRL